MFAQRRPSEDWAFQRAPKSTSAVAWFAWFVPWILFCHVWLVRMDVSDTGFGRKHNTTHCHCKGKVLSQSFQWGAGLTTTPFNYSISGVGPIIQAARIKLHAGGVHPAGYPFHSGPQQQVLAKRTRVARTYCRTVLENSVVSWAELKRTLAQNVHHRIGHVCCERKAPLPCGFFLFCCVFHFLFQVLIEMDAFRRKGLKLRFVAVILEQSGKELERVRLRHRVHFNYRNIGCDSDVFRR